MHAPSHRLRLVISVVCVLTFASFLGAAWALQQSHDYSRTSRMRLCQSVQQSRLIDRLTLNRLENIELDLADSDGERFAIADRYSRIFDQVKDPNCSKIISP